MVVALLGILKAGGAYVPLDPSNPAQRLKYLLADCAPVLLLTDEVGRAALSGQALSIPAIDLGNGQRWSQCSVENLRATELGLRPDHLAYVIYTSGSTGEPKGAMNEHRAVVNRLHWMQQRYQLEERDRVLQKTPFSFDVSVWEFFWTLLNGARLVMARPQGHQDPAYLRELIEHTGVTRAHFVPSMLQAFLQGHRAGQCVSLRQIVCSGEELSAALQERFLASFGQVQLSNLYGPTEAAIDVTAWECRREDRYLRVPIGRPIANTQIYILDGHRSPVPVGVEAEIYIGGAGVARGYLNRPELTAERFVEDPFSATAGARMYKTGDVGRWRADGNIEFIGRNDAQVKIRGYRIELGEIEARLLEHARVKEAVVLAREDAPGERRLVAYYTVSALSDASPEGVGAEEPRGHLEALLPGYMVPVAYVQLERLPLTANGKVDRNALPAPTGSALVLAAYEAPLGPIEESLARIWAEALGVERVGRYDSFFELGGHSLLAVRVISRVRKLLDVRVDLMELLTGPTLAQFAKHIDVLLAYSQADRLPGSDGARGGVL
jgi:amino acid adenylation domain-containing protein